MMIPRTNCKNCGAPLHGTVCEFCGTVYNDDQYLELRNLQDELRLLSLKLSVHNQVQAIMSQDFNTVKKKRNRLNSKKLFIRKDRKDERDR